MATLSELADSGKLVRLEVDLEDRLPLRCLFATPELVQWLEDELPNLPNGSASADTTPLEQVDALFFDFITGVPFVENRRFRALRFEPDIFVWELKTIDVRIFGWFVRMDHFVCCFADHKENLLTTPGRVERLMAQTAYARQKLDLDEPKYIEFKGYANVLSDKD